MKFTYYIVDIMLTTEEKLQILKYKKDGMSLYEIGNKVNMKKSAVQKVIERYQKPMKKKGRKSKLTKYHRREIKSSFF